MCEGSKIYSGIHHLVRRRNIISWRSRGSPGVLLLAPSETTDKEYPDRADKETLEEGSSIRQRDDEPIGCRPF